MMNDVHVHLGLIKYYTQIMHELKKINFADTILIDFRSANFRETSYKVTSVTINSE